MVISNNTEASSDNFIDLLEETKIGLLDTGDKLINEYGTNFEPIVYNIMKDKAINTQFENSIELISGHKFPDIIAKKYYGVEVKTTKRDHWKTTGNSVLESTRVSSVENIYILFAKMINPIEIKFRKYEECLSEVTVTHSPRYIIDMELKKGNTIFDKIQQEYDEIRKQSNPIKPFIDYYRNLLKEKGLKSELWWLTYEDDDNPKPFENSKMVFHSWKDLTTDEKEEIECKGMILFPEIYNKHNMKYERLGMWLTTNCNIVNNNLRDSFSAGGQESIPGISDKPLPRKIFILFDRLEFILKLLNNYPCDELSYYWNEEVNNSNKLEMWINLVNSNYIQNDKYKEYNLNIKEELLKKIEKIKNGEK